MIETEKRTVSANERLYWNIVKGIAVFLMIYGHCIQYCALNSFDFFENSIFKFIYSFHMPLFMLVSGYLFYYSFQKRPLKTLLSHRAESLVYPIVFATILNNIIMLVPNTYVYSNFRILDGALLNGHERSLWFLWSVLSSSIVVGTVCKVTENRWLQGVYTLVGGVFVALFPNHNLNLFMYPFFAVGFFGGMYKEQLKKHFRKGFLLFLIFPVLLYFYKTEHFIYITPIYNPENGAFQSFQINLFRFVIGIAGSGCTLYLTYAAVRHILHKRPDSFLMKAVSTLGENSLQIYCLSYSLLSGYLPIVFRKLMKPFGHNIMADNWYVYNLLFTPLLSVAYCIGLYFIVYLLRRAKIHKLIFGRD